jgi:hypothetical protein
MHITKSMLFSAIFNVVNLLGVLVSEVNTLKIAENSIDFVKCMGNPL